MTTMVTTADLSDAEVRRIIASLGVRQRTMLRAFQDGARHMQWAADQRVCESLAKRGMPLLLQAQATFALTDLGRRVVEQLDA